MPDQQTPPSVREILDRYTGNVRLNGSISKEQAEAQINWLLIRERLKDTGLKDENGTDIYEGDIVKVNTGNRDTGGVGEIKWFESLSNFAIIGIKNKPHQHGVPDMCRKGCMYHRLTAIIARHAEVIGNIHQNPELLK